MEIKTGETYRVVSKDTVTGFGGTDLRVGDVFTVTEIDDDKGVWTTDTTFFGSTSLNDRGWTIGYEPILRKLVKKVEA